MRLLSAGFVLAMLLPFAVTQLMICDTPFFNDTPALRRTYRIGLAINLTGNLLALLVVNAIIFHTGNPIGRILHVLWQQGAYQDYELLALSSAFCLLFAAVLAMIVRGVFYRWNWNEFSKINVLLLLLVLWLPLLFAGCSVGYHGADKVTIEEICRRTTVEEAGADGETIEREIGYVTLRNQGTLTCRLDRLYLSDNQDDLLAYAFSNVEIPPDGVYQITMSKDSGLDLANRRCI